jgi:MFS family permease
MPANGQNLNQETYVHGEIAGSLSSQRRSVLLIYICLFFYWMAIYLYAPVLPVYAKSLGASLTVVGIIVAAYALPQFLFRIPLGVWSDSLGRRKPFIVGGAIMVVIGSVGLGISPSPLFLGISRVFIGVGAATTIVFPVYLVTFYTAEKMGQAIGILNFVTGASMMVATLLGGIIADIQGEKFLFFSAAIIAVISLVCILFAKEYQVHRSGSLSWQELGQGVRRPLLIAASIIGLLLFFAEFSSIWGFIPIYAAKIGASGTALGILTMMVTAGTMIGSLASAPMIKRWGNGWTIVISSLVLGLVLLAVPSIHAIVLLGTVLFIHGVGFGIISTQLMGLSIYNIPPQQRATAMGFYQAVYAIGMLIGPLISGFLSDNYGLPIVFYLGGAICLITISMAYLRVLPGRLILRKKPE